MALLYKARNAMAYAGKVPTLVKMIWAELSSLDTRVSALDGSGEVELSMLEASTEAKMIVYGADGVANDVAMSGDIAIAANGATTIQADAVEQSMIAAGAVGVTELDANGKLYVIRFDHAVADTTNTDTWEKVVGTAPIAGNITTVKFIPDAGLGQDTDTAALTLYNRGVADAGTTAVASKNFTAANAVAARIPASLTVSGVPADVAVTAGQVLTLKKTAAAGNSEVIPPGVLEVTITRTA